VIASIPHMMAAAIVVAHLTVFFDRRRWQLRVAALVVALAPRFTALRLRAERTLCEEAERRLALRPAPEPRAAAVAPPATPIDAFAAQVRSVVPGLSCVHADTVGPDPGPNALPIIVAVRVRIHGAHRHLDEHEWERLRANGVALLPYAVAMRLRITPQGGMA
jgi:hypothetical protein